jgi:decaprenyl-phosphate phosphoribosyltransferase
MVEGHAPAAVVPTAKPRAKELVRMLRPHQWVKNLFVLAPMFFHRDVLLATSAGPALNLAVAGRALAATFAFCLLAGAVYTINDLVDVEADRVHPVKRNRPIASGAVPEPLAKVVATALVVVALGGAAMLSSGVALVAALYFAQNLAYSFKLKHVPFVDVSLISLGFVLRVLAGGYATEVHVSVYMIACTGLLALFLGFGKRRHEITTANAAKQRAALERYSAKALDAALAVTGLATAACYIAYTRDEATRAFFQSDSLWLTSPFVLFGIFRFLHLVGGDGDEKRADSPTEEMLKDVPFVLNLVLWVVAVIAIVYRLRPSV